MLRAFMILLSLMTDREVIADVAQRAFVTGLINASVLGCMGAGLALRRWLANRSQTSPTIEGDE
jgi:hypothetical protein